MGFRLIHGSETSLGALPLIPHGQTSAGASPNGAPYLATVFLFAEGELLLSIVVFLFNGGIYEHTFLGDTCYFGQAS